MADHEWVRAFPGAVTVCDRDGIILEMNERSVASFTDDGGAALIGRNALDCHPEPSRTTLAGLLASGRTNVYTIEKNGMKKLIYQAPWDRDGACAGFVELSLEIPIELPHFVRGG
jgi:transcriptional regulator with PAS, ATPase and Fis domain